MNNIYFNSESNLKNDVNTLNAKIEKAVVEGNEQDLQELYNERLMKGMQLQMYNGCTGRFKSPY